MKRQENGWPPERAATVLIILDMISDFDFPDGTRILRSARRIAPRIYNLKERMHAAGLATIYVNDNLGPWRSDMPQLVRQCKTEGVKSADVTAMMAPRPHDYFVLKPRHSAFYATPLEHLLNHLQAQRLILTGVTSHQCVMFTANDAHVRNFELIVPRDCIAAPKPADTNFALKYFSSVLNADTRPSTSIQPRRLRAGSRKPPARGI